MNRLLIIVAVALLTAAAQPDARQNTRALDKLFASAQHKATVTGDLKGAIEDYKRIVSMSGKDRGAAAKALLLMADAHQKLGDAEAQRIYRRIVNEYSDQKAASGLAASRLRSGLLAASTDEAPVNRSVWTPPSTVDIHGKISPDGRLIPYRDLAVKLGGLPSESAAGLFVRDVTTGVSRRIVGLPDPGDVGDSEYPEGSAFSRDSRRLAYAWRVRKRGIYQLRVVPVEPSPASSIRVLVDNDDIEWLAPYDWTPDGQWIAVVVLRKDRTASLGLVSSKDGSWRQLHSVEWNAVLNVAISPTGDYLAFDRRIQDSGRRDVFAMALDGSHVSPVATSAADDTLVGWSPDGRRVLFVSDRSGSSGLWSVAIARGMATGPPALLYPNVGPFWPLGVTSGGAIWSVVTAPMAAQVQSGRFDMAKLQLTGTQVVDDFAGPTTSLRWSHQDGKLAWASQWLGLRPLTPLVREMQGLRFNVRSADGAARRLPTALAYINDFGWAVDDRSLIAAGEDHTGRTGLFRIDADTGATTALVLTPGEQVDLPPSRAITAEHVYYRRIRISSQTSKLVERDLRTGAERDVLPWAKRFWRGRPEGAEAIDVLTITPDKAVLYLMSETHGNTLSMHVASLTDGSTRELIRTPLPDTLVLFGLTANGREAVVRKDVSGSKKGEVWRVAIDGSKPPVRINAPDDISTFNPIGRSSDGSHLLLGRRLEGDRSEIVSLTSTGEFHSESLPNDAFWTALSPDGQRLAYGTTFRDAAVPLAVWVLEHAIEGQQK